jgi:hypothetical protein
MPEVIFSDSQARGRNGWFKMASASLYTDGHDRINVNIVSKKSAFPGPVVLELSLQDAIALAAELLSISANASHALHGKERSRC